jgi:choline dehydrogenase-like flavoprotein
MAGLIDTRTYSGPLEIDCDLCIAGAGAAGITLALKLARPGRRIVVLESGGLEFDGETQGLYRGRTTGQPYFNLTSCRLRFFGGTTNHWGGRCGLPRPMDFESRPGVGLPGWPIGYDELMPYIEQASALLSIDPRALDPFANPEAAHADLSLAVDGRTDVLRTVPSLQSPPRSRLFNPRYRDEIASLPDTSVFLFANLTHIGLAENGATVEALTVKTLTGKTLRVRARVVVLACHAIENARLLLASNDVQGAGIGNASDQVGRNFMDHLHVQGDRFVANPERPLDFYYPADALAPKAQREFRPYFAFEDEILRGNEMLQYSCTLVPRYTPTQRRTGAAVARLVKGFFDPFDMQMAKDVGTLLQHPMHTAPSVVARLGIGKRAPSHFEVIHNIEQAPNPDSRITLTSEPDALGVPIVSLHWALSEVDYRTFARGQELFMAELSALGLGRFAPQPLTRAFVEQTVLGHWHHMGTTRMSTSSGAGVVDPDCRVHSTRNLYIAGSGVFPSGTSSGPTMMLIALALRLAAHLDTQVLA